MNKATDLVIVSFLDDHKEGNTFVRSKHGGWPLHITIYPWFGVKNFDKFEQELTSITEFTRPFIVEVGEERMFGKDQDVPVRIIENQSNLIKLHKKFDEIVASDGELFDSSWIRDKYNAHITFHHGARMPVEGEAVEVNHVYLVKMLDDDNCRFLKKYPLGAKL